MGRHDRQRRPQLSNLVFFVSTASAISLFNFQPITSLSASLSCILVYNGQIDGCSSSDFTAGYTCSSSCVEGLDEVQSNLQQSCSGTQASSNSVLGEALQGNLIPLLCPSSQTTTTTTVRTTSTTTTSQRTSAQTTTSSHTTTPQSQESSSRSTTSSSSTATETSSQPEQTTVTTVVTPAAQTQTTETETVVPTLLSAQSQETGQAAPTIEAGTAPSALQSVITITTTASSGEPTSNDGRGGGGPFDVTNHENVAASMWAGHWMAAVVSTVAAGLFLLR